MLRTALVRLIGVVALLFSGNVMAVEEAKYTVLSSKDSFELRRYEPHILAETVVDEIFERAGSAAFNRLFKYISGHNTQQQTIAMTTPVGQLSLFQRIIMLQMSLDQKIVMTAPVGQQKQGEQWLISFMMPAVFTLATTPKPKDSTVSIRQVPARLMAAVRYSGVWSEKNYRDHLIKLHAWTESNRLNPIGEPILARYNSPSTPWFLRRNEVLIPVDSSNSVIKADVFSQSK